MQGDLAEHTLALVRELLEDIELDRVPLQTLLMKASRLARLVEDVETLGWLRLEVNGYDNSPLGLKYMARTGRWTDKEAKKGYGQSSLQIEEQISALRLQLEALKLPDVSGDYAALALANATHSIANTTSAITELTKVRSKVIGLLYNFVATRYYELTFSHRQAELFDHARAEVDKLLAPLSGDSLQKVESIYRRLAEGDAEATSQALNTCRRLIDGVANAIYPASDKALEIDGRTISLGPNNIQNRLNAYVRERTASESRRDKLRRTLSDLYGRVSSGVHSDVSIDEARFLFLNTYLYLGEVLSLTAQTGDSKRIQRTDEY